MYDRELVTRLIIKFIHPEGIKGRIAHTPYIGYIEQCPNDEERYHFMTEDGSMSGCMSKKLIIAMEEKRNA